MSRGSQVEAAIAALGDSPDVELVRRVLAEFDVRDIAAAVVSSAAPGVGSQAAGWTGPFKFNTFVVQQLEDSVAGSVTGGTFTATHDGDTTSALTWDVAAADLKAALEALPSIGVGGVLSVTGPNVNSGYIITFNGLAAVELLTTDSALLTGPDAPYNADALGFSGHVPLVTLAAGDVIEDIFWTPRTPFDPTGSLSFADDDQDSTAGLPAWTSYVAAGSTEFDLTASEGFANFYGSSGGDTASVASMAQQMLAQWALDSGEPVRSRLPIIAKEETTIHAWLGSINAAPVAGEVWIWCKTSTAEAPA